MRLRVHHRAPPFGVTLHLPKRVPLALLARPAGVIAGSYIGLRGRAGRDGRDGAPGQGTQDDPGDLTLIFDNMLI